MYPVYHVVAGLTRGTGRQLAAAESSDPARVAALAYRGEKERVLWLANLSADEQAVTLRGTRSPVIGWTLDEDTFVRAATDPRWFQAADAPTTDPATLTLKAYAVGKFRVND